MKLAKKATVYRNAIAQKFGDALTVIWRKLATAWKKASDMGQESSRHRCGNDQHPEAVQYYDQSSRSCRKQAEKLRSEKLMGACCIRHFLAA
ncbi:MAG: hypothetical protein OXC54_04985 [Rhodospirillaceae bacterium]|nr:hypothetical protein [Rhodospirillaceae bacterium]MCY4310652.1 hypothetical protein [Rhodospirillaceae bacterium]